MKRNLLGYFHLFIVYIVWGSNFLAIRYTVREGAGFTPFMLGASRVLLGCVLVFVIGKLTGKSFRIPRTVLLPLFISSLLLWVGGHGLVVWAAQHVDSSYSAILMGAVPLWMVLMESILDRTRPKKVLILSLVIGLCGIVMLSWSKLINASPADSWSLLALICASISWSAGTIIQKRHVRNISPWINSGYQQFIAGLSFLLLCFLFREPLPSPSTEAWIAWGYLVIFGSVLAFTSYIMAVQLLPIRVVMTYCYVNPVIAIILGLFLLKEPLTSWMAGGCIMILLSVFGIFQFGPLKRKTSFDDPVNK
jgi:drug/metabolite transporter (DMT)-like permease